MTAPDTGEIAPSGTPASIVFALLCFAFAVAAPFFGFVLVVPAAEPGGWGAMVATAPWVLAAAVAALIGIICTIVGATRAPRSEVTIVAIVIACVFGFGFLMMLLVIAPGAGS